jgi:hypothetical protein
MKKLLIILFSLIVVFISAALIAAAVLPKNFKIERSIIIDQPRVQVYDYLKMTRNEIKWNPWIKKDPNIVQHFIGEEGTAGFVRAWSSDDQNVGIGEQEIVAMTQNERIDLELRFVEPFKITHQAYFITERFGEDQTRVTWGMVGRNSFPKNLIFYLTQDRALKNVEKGLNNLKEVLESTDQ